MLYALLFVSVVLLVAVSAVRITRANGSRFELERQDKEGDETARRILARESRLADLQSLQRALVALLMICIALLSVAAYGWGLGILVAVVIVLSYGVVSRQEFIRSFVQPRYQAAEPTLLHWIDKAPYVFSVIRTVVANPAEDPVLSSKQQLLHLVETSRGVLTPEQKVQLRKGLSFSGVSVSEIMTPRSMIEGIEASELLGPLVLDDLHKTGHSRFPVIEEDIDHVVGMLYIHDLLVLDASRKTMTAAKAMEPRVFYIKQSQTLDHALAAFLKSRHHLFVVVNEYRETVGLLSLEDVIETLLGRRIVDEFDAHEDLRAVAERNPRRNNHPKTHTDV